VRRLAFALLLLLAAAPAHATLLFAGGEDSDFTLGTSCGTCAPDSTDTSTWRTNFARESLLIVRGSSPTTGPFLKTPAFTAETVLWFHAQTCNYDGSGGCNMLKTASNTILLNFFGADGNPAILIRGTGTDSQVKISKIDTSGTITDLATCGAGTYPSGGLDQLDVYLNYAVAGEVTLYRNSSQFCDYTGDVTTNSRTQINQAAIGGINGNGLSFYTNWSEIIIATTRTTAMNLWTLAPNGAGNATDWTGANPCTAIVNAKTINQASYINTASTAVINECTVTNSVPSGDYTPLALVMSMNGLVGATGPQNFDFLTRTGGADYASSDMALTNTFGNVGNYIQTLNPASSAAWAIGDWTAVGFNVGVESKP
jgi:hypothetical protein